MLLLNDSLSNAVLVLKRAIRSDPDHPECKQLLSQIRESTRAKREREREFDAHMKAAEDFLSRRLYADAAESFTRVLSLFPSPSPLSSQEERERRGRIHDRKAECHLLLRQYLPALCHSSLSVHFSSASAECWVRRGGIRSELGLYEGAVADYEKAAGMGGGMKQVNGIGRSSDFDLLIFMQTRFALCFSHSLILSSASSAGPPKSKRCSAEG